MRCQRKLFDKTIQINLIVIIFLFLAAFFNSLNAQNSTHRLGGIAVAYGYDQGGEGRKPLFLYITYQSRVRNLGVDIATRTTAIMDDYLNEYLGGGYVDSIFLADWGGRRLNLIDKELQKKHSCCIDCFDVCYTANVGISNTALKDYNYRLIDFQFSRNLTSEYYRNNLQTNTTSSYYYDENGRLSKGYVWGTLIGTAIIVAYALSI